ncbi:MAG: hypothetical protein IPP71_22395 [Bacteroidetes bacterium]|nr:hypothetical protein [Bacteroidota bacterium]
MNLCKAVVLVAPLDWGLGHATRCIPIIRELLNQNAMVLCSAQGRGGAILKREFPALKFVDIPGYQFVYPEKGSMAVSILRQLPNFLISIKNEHAILAELIETHHITHVISDNRYGLYSNKVKSVFITHQIKIKSSRSLWFLEPILFHANKKRIEKFDELWIPDEPLPNNLSGTLSDSAGINIPVKHIGILSRFKELTQPIEKVYDVIALLSGPEPQRTILEKNYLCILLPLEKDACW